jgi:hypothetical protein
MSKANAIQDLLWLAKRFSGVLEAVPELQNLTALENQKKELTEGISQGRLEAEEARKERQAAHDEAKAVREEAKRVLKEAKEQAKEAKRLADQTAREAIQKAKAEAQDLLRAAAQQEAAIHRVVSEHEEKIASLVDDTHKQEARRQAVLATIEKLKNEL